MHPIQIRARFAEYQECARSNTPVRFAGTPFSCRALGRTTRCPKTEPPASAVCAVLEPIQHVLRTGQHVHYGYEPKKCRIKGAHGCSNNVVLETVKQCFETPDMSLFSSRALELQNTASTQRFVPILPGMTVAGQFLTPLNPNRNQSKYPTSCCHGSSGEP